MPRGLESCNVCARLFSVLVGGLCEGCIRARSAITKDKICSRCHVVRPMTDYYKRTDGSIMATCKPCFLEADRRAKEARKKEEKKKAERKPRDPVPVPLPGPTAEEIRAAKEEARAIAARARIEAAKVADSRPRLKKGGRPRLRHLDDPMHDCTICERRLPADLFYVDVKRGAVHPHCLDCVRQRQRNRQNKNEIIFVLGKLLLWRMAYDAAFPKNFLAST